MILIIFDLQLYIFSSFLFQNFFLKLLYDLRLLMSFCCPSGLPDPEIVIAKILILIPSHHNLEARLVCWLDLSLTGHSSLIFFYKCYPSRLNGLQTLSFVLLIYNSWLLDSCFLFRVSQLNFCNRGRLRLRDKSWNDIDLASSIFEVLHKFLDPLTVGGILNLQTIDQLVINRLCWKIEDLSLSEKSFQIEILGNFKAWLLYNEIVDNLAFFVLLMRRSHGSTSAFLIDVRNCFHKIMEDWNLLLLLLLLLLMAMVLIN